LRKGTVALKIDTVRNKKTSNGINARWKYEQKVQVKMTEVPPILLSAIICERVIFDKITGMPSIINIIQNINAPKYPVRYPALVFFCELTNGHGRTKTTIRLVEEQEEEKVIFEQKGVAEFKDVRQVVSLALNLRGIVFSREGEYRFQLFAEDHLLGERRIVCRKVTLPPKGGGKNAR